MANYNRPYPNYNNKKEPDGGSELASWIIIGLCFMFAWPVGVLLLISKLRDNKSAGKVRRPTVDNRTAHQSQQTYARPVYQQPAAQPYQQGQYAQSAGQYQQSAQQQPAAQAPNRANVTKKLTRTPVPSAKKSLWMRIVGLCIAIIAGIAGLNVAAEMVGSFLAGWEIYQFEIVALLQSLGWLSGGMILFGFGQRMKRRALRFQKYVAVMGNRTSISLRELSSAAGMSQEKVEKDIRKMMENGYFGTSAYFDEGADMLFLTPQAAERFAKEKKAQTVHVPKEAEEGYSGILRNIRRANDRIADPVLSEKIDRLEDITARIFQAIEKDPQRKKQVGTFMDYYLPTTQKLLDSYAEFEEAGVEGENLRQAKQRIEETMDTIVAGFENQLDSLYKAKTMDLDSDIRVMETMMRRERSSVEEDFGISVNGGKTQDIDLGGMAAQQEK